MSFLLNPCSYYPKLLSEHKSDIVGQGLKYCYCVRILGTGSNKYVFHLKHEETYATFTTYDKFIIEWCVRSYPEHPEGKERTDIIFESYGMLNNCTGCYIYISDENHVDFDNVTYKVIDCEVTCSVDPQTCIKPNISNCNTFCEYRDIIYTNIELFKSEQAPSWIVDLKYDESEQTAIFEHVITEHTYCFYEIDFSKCVIDHYGASSNYTETYFAKSFIVGEKWIQEWKQICNYVSGFKAQLLQFLLMFEKDYIRKHMCLA